MIASAWRRYSHSGWMAASLILWAADWLTTEWLLSAGHLEGNGIAAYFQSYFGVTGYALVLLPTMAIRGALAANEQQTTVMRAARILCRVAIVFHVLVVLNNFGIVVATLLGVA